MKEGYMGTYERVILIKNAVETLGYFSEQIAQEMEKQGKEIYFIDYDRLEQTLVGLSHFLKKGRVAFITFNYIGLSGENIFFTERGRSVWEAYEVRILNILVDHPMYYHSKLQKNYWNMQLFCLDREHVAYVKRFYPHINVAFFPTAGNEMLGENFRQQEGEQTIHKVDCRREEKAVIPFEEREWDIVFTGNYVPTSLFEKRLRAQGAEYEEFYRGMIDDLLERPWQSIDKVIEQHIIDELGEVSEADLCASLGNLIFIDQWVRSEVRSKVIRELIAQGLKIYLVGADWNQFSSSETRSLHYSTGMVTSFACVEAIQKAKISLNVMPWFRDGVHDRVFTAMLQKTVSVTDESRYLREVFKDGEDIVFYSLSELEKLPKQIEYLLNNPREMTKIAEKGYEIASKKHTWENRAKELMSYLY